MRAVVQRVLEAEVTVGNATKGKIGKGLLVLLGVQDGDTLDDASFIVEKVIGLRCFADNEGKFNRSVEQVGGSVLVVSQFTLLGDCRKGRRPSFSAAARPDLADTLYQEVVVQIRAKGIPVETGAFGAHMLVSSINDGPVTLLLDSRRLF